MSMSSRWYERAQFIHHYLHQRIATARAATRPRLRSRLSKAGQPQAMVLEALEPRQLLDGLPTVTAFHINDDAEQRSMVTSISVQFSEDVSASLNTSDLVLRNLTTNQDVDPGNIALAYDTATNTATFTFPGLAGETLANGNYTVTLNASEITNGAGDALDGNGDGLSLGTARDNYSFDLYRYFGDSDGDRDVDNLDLFRFRQTFPKNGGDSGFNPIFDSDADGDVDNLDLFWFRQTFTTSLAAPVAITASLNHDTAPPGSGPLASDGITSDPEVTGRVAFHEDAAKVLLGLDAPGSSFIEITSLLGPNGGFLLSRSQLESLLGGTLEDGAHTLHLQALDADGNTLSSADVSFTLDTTAPATPTFGLDAGSRLNAANAALTEQATINLEGQADPGVEVVLNPGGITATADASGNFSFTGLPVGLGLNPLTASVTDIAGNQTTFSLSIARLEQGPPPSGLLLHEDGVWVVEQAQLIDLGQEEGSRTLRFELTPQFDTTDTVPILEDLFQVYLMDPQQPGQTLLDRGVPGTALFSLAGDQADFLPGLVRFDGRAVEVDLTSLKDKTQGLLVFQLINSDADEGTQVQVAAITNTVDEEGVESPVFPQTPMFVHPGGALDLAGLTESAELEVVLENIRLVQETGRYTAQLTVRNHGSTIGRTVVVVFPGLPSDVTLLNASGTDTNGDAYLNLRGAILPGGLSSGTESQPIEVMFDNPNLTRFSLTPKVLVGGPNQAPTFATVGPLTVLPGGKLEVQLVATDPDGDRVTFSIQSDGGDLPSGVLKADGTLMFKPQPDQLGSYQFTLIASDGALQAAQDVTLHVVPDPTTTTRISGVVLDTDGTPLVGVPVSLSRMTVMTDSQGRFTIELPSYLLPAEAFDLVIPTGDPSFDPLSTGTQKIFFFRSGFDAQTGTDTSNPRLHPNLVTSFLDASMVYGSDDARALALRTLSGGKLKTSSSPGGDLLPFNNLETFPDGMLENDVSGVADPATMFVAGDVRASENVALSALQAVLLREHNRLADQIAAANPTLTDEEIYQGARRMVGAIIQHITYNEYLPLLLGSDAIAPYAGYDPTVNPDTGSFFATAAFRLGHSQMVSQLLRLDTNGDSLPGGPLSLREASFNPQPLAADGVEPILRGLVAQQAEEIDTKIVDELRNFLFGPPGSGGMDLPAMSIQRGRDLGLPSYTQARLDFGLSPITSFDQITSDPTVRAMLESVYDSVDQIDAFVGGLAEDHVPGAMVGPLFRAVIARQFERTRDGDRFWYENGQFTAPELEQIRNTTLADLIERNTAITGLPDNVFTTGTPGSTPAPAGTAASGSVTDFRSLDGMGNNPLNPELGSTGQHLLIDSSLNYADGVSTPNGGDRPLAREVSNAVMAQSASIPNSSGATALSVFWGQIISHDLSLTPTGISDTLKVHADQASIPDKAYPFVAEKLGLLLGHEVYAGVDNVIDRPIFLPALDVASGSTIDPGQDTMVHGDLDHDGTPDSNAMVFVAANTLQDRDGHPFTGTLSITQVPTTLTPAALPENLFPDLVVTIQPAEMVFTAPAPLSLPNRAGYAPGTLMDLWSINPVTGFFDDVGEGVVSPDGAMITTTSGGIRNSSWHFFAPPPTNPEDPNQNDDNEDDGCDCQKKASAPSSSEVELHSGALIETHNLVPYQSLGESIGLQLTYDSLRADPRPIIHFSYQNLLGLNAGAPFYLVGKMSVSRGGITYQVPGYSGNQFGLSGGEHFWKLSPDGGAIEAALQVDLGSPDSGKYDYMLDTGLRRFNGSAFAGSDATSTGSFLIVNAINSPFGAGWGLAGLDELIENPDGSVLLIDGNSSQLLFNAPPTGSNPGDPYMSPPGDFTTLVKLGDGTFQRTTKDQTVYRYNTANKLTSVTDRNDNVTSYTYDGSNRLIKITDPVGLETVFDYSGPTGGGVRVTSITDPAGRVTHLEYDAAGNLIRVSDPDGTFRAWEYDAQHHMTGEVDKRGEHEQSFYDFAGRVTGSIHKDGTTQQFAPVQTRSLLPADNTIDPLNAPVVFSLTREAESDHTDSNGNVIHTVLNQRGAVLSTSDSAGNLPSNERDSRNLVTQQTDGRGNETTYAYDANGNVLSISDPIAFGGSIGSLFPGAVYPLENGSLVNASADLNGDGVSDLIIVRTNQSVISVIYGNVDGSFPASSTDFAIASRANSLTTADLNGDGRTDVITANIFANSLSVLLGNDNGSLNPRVDYATGNGTLQVNAVDLNKDNKLDLVAVNRDSSTLSVLLGNGDGTVQSQTQFAIGAEPRGFDIGDLDKDGNLDVVVANVGDNSLSVLLGKNDGTFNPFAKLTHAGGPHAVAIADFNQDGNLDLAVGNLRGGSVGIRLGQGDGAFGSSTNITVAGGSAIVIKTDFDGDGRIDLISTPDRSQGIGTLLRGKGDGTFAISEFPLASRNPFVSYALPLDVDLDGNIDLVTSAIDNSSTGTSRFVVLNGRGDGTFATRTDYPAGNFPTSIATADFNSDGVLDVATANRFDHHVSVLLGNGDGTLGVRDTFATHGLTKNTPSFVMAADVNTDGKADLVTTGGSGQVSVLLGNGLGGFTLRPVINVGHGFGIVATGDFNNDNQIDLVVTEHFGGKIALFSGNGDGTYGSKIEFSVVGNPGALAVGDVNGDGNLDVVTANITGGDLSVLLGNGNNGFPTRIDIDKPGRKGILSLADLNDDGKLDLVVPNYGSDNSVSVAMGNGDGTFGNFVDYDILAPYQPWSVVVMDFNGDGIMDVAADNNLDPTGQYLNSSVSLLLGVGDGTFGPASVYAMAGRPEIGAGDLNGDGRPDLITADFITGSVSVLLNQDGGTDNIPRGTGHRDFTYDPIFNQLTGMTDELGRQTLYDLDPANGNVVKMTRVVGELDTASGGGETDDIITSYTYESHGLIDLMTDPLGRVTDYDYDPLGRMILITVAKGTADEAIMRYEYDAAGNRTAVIDANGHRTEYQYDALNRLTRVIEADPDGDIALGGGLLTSPVTQFVYDANGNLLSTTDARGNVTTNEYDDMNRLIQRTDPDPDGVAGPAVSPITTFTYDEQGNIVTVTDPNGNVTTSVYDARNRLVRTIDPDGGITRFRYDADNNTTSVTDPVGNITRFAYDQRNRVVLETDPLGKSTRYTYDPVDNLIATTDRNGRKTRYAYDDLDRLTQETWLDATGATANTVDYTYDQASNLLSIEDDFSKLTYTYDNRDRVKTADNTGTPTGVPAVQLTYTYDGVGNVLSVEDSLGGVTTYSYDALDRLIQETQSEAPGGGGGGDVSDKRVDFAYNPLGQFESIQRYSDLLGSPGSLVIDTGYQYDSLNRLASLTHRNPGGTPVSFFNFEYDPASRIKAITDVDGRTDYSYDDRDELTGADHADAANPDENYLYDANGNRISSSLHGTGYVTGPNNRLLSDGTFNYAYDDEGNMVTRTQIATGQVREFDYDHRNRLVRVTDRVSAGGVITQEVAFIYDALNRRIAKVFDADAPGSGADPVTTHFVYDREDVILDFVDTDSSAGPNLPVLATRYLHGPGIDTILAQENYDPATGLSADVLWLLTDHLGTTRDLASNAGAVLNHLRYDSYGNVIAQSDPSITTRYQFTGREFDSETGLHYYRARYYNSNVGRFVNEDLIGLAGQDLNLFIYVQNTPLILHDPLGLLSIGFSGYSGLGAGFAGAITPGGVSFTGDIGFGFGGGFLFDPFGGLEPTEAFIKTEVSASYRGFGGRVEGKYSSLDGYSGRMSASVSADGVSVSYDPVSGKVSTKYKTGGPTASRNWSAKTTIGGSWNLPFPWSDSHNDIACDPISFSQQAYSDWSDQSSQNLWNFRKRKASFAPNDPIFPNDPTF